MTDTDSGDEEDVYRASCYDCDFTPANGRLPRHPVMIVHDDGGYDRVPVPLCRRCRAERFGYPCPQCGMTHDDKESAEYCCRRRPSEAPDCLECGRRMEATAKGYGPIEGPTVTVAECESCDVGWGRYTGWFKLDTAEESG